MGRRTINKFIIRSFILLISIIITLINPNELINIMNFNLIFNIKIHNIFWCYLMYEMIIVLIPKLNDYTYSGKLFNRHFYESKNFSSEKLKKYTKKNYKRAFNALVFWTSLNGVIAYFYFKFELSPIYMYLLFLFYYWSDTFCINVWCPFHKIIVKNKCCNECRIYNWGHIMYLTPLMFIPSLWTYSLVFVGIVIFLQWEYMNMKYPERFSPISNEILRCNMCENDCRYNKQKKNKIKLEEVA